MNFPQDHYFHFGKYSVEWQYFWGKLDTGDFFHFTEHCVTLGGNKTKYVHHSINGDFKNEVDTYKEDILSTSGFAFGRFNFQTSRLGLTFKLTSKPIIHSTKMERRNYYSIPYLEGHGHYKGKK